MITDTQYIIDILAGEENAIRKSEELADGDRPQNLCTLVIYEVLMGIEFIRSRK